MGDEGLERTAGFPADSHEASHQCAHLCAVLEIPACVRESGRIAAWNRLPEDFRRRLASLPPDVLAALEALFSGAPPETRLLPIKISVASAFPGIDNNIGLLKLCVAKIEARLLLRPGLPALPV